MRKINKIIITVVSLTLAILICMFTVRNSVIREQDWKVTGGANLKNDFIYFSEGSDYSYSCPLIRENDEIIAIALFQFKGKLIVFNIEKMSFSFLMYI